MSKPEPYRLIVSGGGTGGHIFPAVAIANAFRERHPDAQILFVGAKGRMEMTRVPEAGYKIIGLWISGLQRKLTLSNALFPVKLIVSYVRAISIVKKFKPHAVIGTGGYASGPIMIAATRSGIPTVIQEQNSFAGLANKQVAEKVTRICVAYDGMAKYFPKEKIVLTGNPVRKDILGVGEKRQKALTHFGFTANTKTLLIIGGSLGARTVNESILKGIEKLIDANVQVIWQTGKGYFDAYKNALAAYDLKKIRVQDFLKEMDLAYAAADVVISRSGALSVSELCIAKKPCILVPSPNVAEDHQTKNAMALVEKDAALMIADKDAREVLIDEALRLLFDENRCNKLSQNIEKLARPNATADIVSEIEKIIGANSSSEVKIQSEH
ncbi:undecaprenyldiphospho-muramoylpentapeptide beta-N-acetylglucosaminyltransferase [Chryseosolibacter indicus]|uniref:UDP-N-acetylglucosamine--N-acetylmuramyl-(pentapeptide) pyrophosphoryl-undecaprenol N-acetylglucosamine transferase n=1 Tax=Chryseosolibacter indicus TaxID=2782351 RepID=A0ABS5VSG8_9BACT|nr:undecaprenyldiphospho-muramoylpentapeptide beta-N-acetylglucosaminyltransferase [Chryseosolibacter indicus]MBT1704141.1 undecaprenyldiphospho-muramoylpentapeptide beta-N-acetylglucosaminyltransferase [Chryseosolibacter indicus]